MRFRGYRSLTGGQGSRTHEDDLSNVPLRAGDDRGPEGVVN